MILPDVNVLVYAFRREAPQHETYAEWLADLVAGADELALADHCVSGFLRIATNPRIFADPAPPPLAVSFVQRLLQARRSRRVAATSATWERLFQLITDDRAIRGNLLPDAYLAALATSHGSRLATSDRGFARYPGLTLVDPLTA